MDRRAFDQLLVEGLPAAGRFAIRLTGDPTSAEDLLHDSIVRASRAWQSYRGESRFTTWWFQIIVNAWRDRAGRRAAAPLSLAEPATDANDDPPSRVAGKELATMIAGMVSNLPPRQREVFVLLTYEGFDVAAAAELLGVSAGNVRTNLSLARGTLRRRLAPYLDERRRGMIHEA